MANEENWASALHARLEEHSAKRRASKSSPPILFPGLADFSDEMVLRIPVLPNHLDPQVLIARAKGVDGLPAHHIRS